MTVPLKLVVGAACSVVDAVVSRAHIDVSAGLIIGFREFAGLLSDGCTALAETHVRPRGLSDANNRHDNAPDTKPAWLALTGLA